MGRIYLYSLTFYFIFQCSAAALAAQHPQALDAHLGQVISAQPGAQLIRDQEAKPLTAGMKLLVGDRITTSASSGAMLLLESKPVQAGLLVKPGTEMELTAPDVNARVGLQLVKGAVLSDIHNPEKKPHPFTIRTRSATMGVRGTVFFVKTDPTTPTFVCTCVGAVTLASPDGTSRMTVISKHHDSPKMIADGAAPITGRLTSAKMGHDHSDTEGQELEMMLKQHPL